jgi:precorrin-6Y C5,15-methyltransferase (decarboxylating) CbiT subunit
MSVDPYSWPYRTPGIPDQAFDRLAGIPLSPREVRVLILSQLRLRSQDCLWDIGAGTGTIAVEAGLLCPEGKILAIERDSEVGELIQRNCARFSVANVTVCQGNAPECLGQLHPLPDRICLEGGQSLSSLLEESWYYLKSGGRLVAIATSLEALNALSMALATVQARHVEVSQALVNRLEHRGKGQSFVAMDPVFILSGEKGD